MAPALLIHAQPGPTHPRTCIRLPNKSSWRSDSSCGVSCGISQNFDPAYRGNDCVAGLEEGQETFISARGGQDQDVAVE
jgi:hypothetical protein